MLECNTPCDEETPGLYRLEDIQPAATMKSEKMIIEPGYSFVETSCSRLEDIQRYRADIRCEVEEQVRAQIRHEHASLHQRIEQMQLEKDAMMWRMQQEKEAITQKMQQEKHHFEMTLKRKAKEDAVRMEMEKHIQMEKTKDFLAKEKHWSVDSWEKACSPSIRPIVTAFLKTIPTETVYAIYTNSIREYGQQVMNGMYAITSNQFTATQVYIATDAKVYMLTIGGDINGNYQIGPGTVFKEIVKFPSEPTPTFWRAVFSQMGHENAVYTTNGNTNIYHLANAKLEALFRSFQ